MHLARHLDVPASFISKMASGTKPVPLDHCPLIQSFTEGQVTCEELRPDKVEYFALIRAQAATLPLADRRNPAAVNPFPDLDRHSPAAVAGEGA